MYFNSHAHVERDFLLSSTFTILVISTHTLTWSVTSRSETNQRTLWFQLTRSRGAWRQWKTVYSKYVTFQLTRSRGAWLEYSDSRGQTGNFNSHAHVERDLICLKSQKIIIHISTHTLTWSVTRFVNTAEVYLQFQLTRSRGAWRNGKCCKYWFYISTHTLTWSVTEGVQWNDRWWKFQLTRSRGAWRVLFVVQI